MGCCNKDKKHHKPPHHKPPVPDPDKYIDVSQIPSVDYDDIDRLLGLNECGMPYAVEKPEKLEKIKIDGDGTRFLSDDGEYKDVSEITSDLNYVKYNNADDAEFRDDALLNNNSFLKGKNKTGNNIPLAGIDSNNNAVLGDITLPTIIASRNRPTVFTIENGDEITKRVAYQDEIPDVSDLQALRADVDKNTADISTVNSNVATINSKIVTIESDVSANKTDISTLKTRVTNVEAKSSTNESNISNVSSRVTVVEGQTANNKTEIDDLKPRVSAVETKSTDNETAISDLSTRMGTAESKIVVNETDIADLKTRATAVEVKAANNETSIATNTSDISDIKTELANTEHFRGYHESNVDVTLLPNPKNGDYAYSAESGTVWSYNGTTWINTGRLVPDKITPASDLMPNMDGAASSGSVGSYSRGDHRHPTDTTRASASDLITTSQNVTNIQTDLSGYKTSNDSRVGAVESRVSTNETDIANLKTRTTAVESKTDTNKTDLDNIKPRLSTVENKTSTNETNISNLDNRVTSNETAVTGLITRMGAAEGSISANTTDIEALKNAISDTENFRGYYALTSQITSLPNPKTGNYAWSAQSGTVWSYNGVTWMDTGDPIPDKSAPASALLPTMDGVAKTGTEDAYSRGDHTHPTDNTRAAASDLTTTNQNVSALETNLNGYKITNDSRVVNVEAKANATETKANANEAALNSLGTRVTTNEGDINTNKADVAGVKTRLDAVEVKANATESALNSYKTTNDNRVADIETEVSNLLDDLSAYKTTNDSRVGAVETKAASNESAISALGGRMTTSEGKISTNETDIADLKNRTLTVETKASTNETNITNIDSRVTAVEGKVNANESAISGLDTRVTTNESDITALKSAVNNQENFRGYYTTTALIEAIPNPQDGNYAWNGETGTVWNYNGANWTDTGNPIPDTNIIPSDTLPLEDGVADAGTSTAYSRGDHRHPTDTSRAAASDLTTTNQNVSTLETNLSGYKITNDGRVSAVETKANANETAISGLTTRIGTAEGDITNLKSDVSDLEDEIGATNENVTSLSGRVSVNETAIGNAANRLTAVETKANATETKANSNESAISGLTTRVGTAEGNINTNKTEVDGIKPRLDAVENDKVNRSELSVVAKTGSYTDLTNTPVIPANTSDLNNDSGFITVSSVPVASNAAPVMDGVANAGSSAGFSRSDHRHPSDNKKADISDIPTKLSQLDNDPGFITNADLATDAIIEVTPSASSTVVTLPNPVYTPSSSFVYINGLLQSESDYSVLGAIITFTNYDFDGVNDHVTVKYSYKN